MSGSHQSDIYKQRATKSLLTSACIQKKNNKTQFKGDYVIVFLPGARIEHVTERIENALGHGQGGSRLVHIGTINYNMEGTTRIVQKCRVLVGKRNKIRVEQIILSESLPVTGGKETIYINCKRMAINALVEQICQEDAVGFKDCEDICCWR